LKCDTSKSYECGTLGKVYNVTSEDESSSADKKNHSTGRKRRLNTNQKTASSDSATEEEVPNSYGSKLRVWETLFNEDRGKSSSK
jgi:hypothetical protein